MPGPQSRILFLLKRENGYWGIASSLQNRSFWLVELQEAWPCQSEGKIQQMLPCGGVSLSQWSPTGLPSHAEHQSGKFHTPCFIGGEIFLKYILIHCKVEGFTWEEWRGLQSLLSHRFYGGPETRSLHGWTQGWSVFLYPVLAGVQPTPPTAPLGEEEEHIEKTQRIEAGGVQLWSQVPGFKSKSCPPAWR